MVHNQRCQTGELSQLQQNIQPSVCLPQVHGSAQKVVPLHIHRARAAVHPSASTPPCPCPTAIIRPFPKTFASSFPVQNPKIIVRSYLKPFTARRTTGTNKTLLGEPSLAVYSRTQKAQSQSSGTPEHAWSFVWPSPWIMNLHCNDLPRAEAEQLWVMLGHPGHVSSLIGENASARGACASHSSLQENTAVLLHVRVWRGNQALDVERKQGNTGVENKQGV